MSIDILLSVQQVAKLMNVSESTVRRMEEADDLVTSGQGGYRFPLGNILAIRSEKSQLKTKFSVEGIKAKDLKEIVEIFDDDADVMLVIEEFDPSRSGSVTQKYNLAVPRAIITIGLYGKGPDGRGHAKNWVI